MQQIIFSVSWTEEHKNQGLISVVYTMSEILVSLILQRIRKNKKQKKLNFIYLIYSPFIVVVYSKKKNKIERFGNFYMQSNLI